MPIRHLIAYCAALTLVVAPPELGAEEAANPSSWEKISDALRGSLTVGIYHHFEEAKQEATNTRYQAQLELEFEGEIQDHLHYFLTPQLYLDNLGWASGIVNEEPETSTDRFIVDVEEAYMRYTAEKLDLTLGRQIFNWGVADAFNPNNNINPLDLLDVPTLKKMGVFSGTLRYSDENLNASLVVIPWFTPARIPGDNSRWQGDLGEAASQFSGFDLTVGPRELPDKTLDNAAYALRFGSSTLLSGWDIAVSFYDGIDSIGVLRGDLMSAQQIALTQVFPQFQETGLSFSTTWESLEFHGEAGFHDTADNTMDDDYLEYVLGINFTYYNLPLTEETFVIVEYADEQIIHDQSANSPFSGSGEYVRAFQGTWITSIKFTFNQDTQLTVSALRNEGSQDGVWRTKLSHKFNDSLKLEVGSDFIYGSPDTFFGRWRDNDRIFANLTLFL